MKIFLSWSGNRSHQVAQELSHFIKMIIQATDPWISSEIDKGTNWASQISKELEATKLSIICLTPENLHADWILFEEGALSKSRDSHVCTLLVGLKPTDVEPPLSQFQHTLLDENDIKKLLFTINKKSEKPLDDKLLDHMFNLCWPEFKEKTDGLLVFDSGSAEKVRSDRDILEEILSLIRTISFDGYLPNYGSEVSDNFDFPFNSNSIIGSKRTKDFFSPGDLQRFIMKMEFDEFLRRKHGLTDEKGSIESE